VPQRSVAAMAYLIESKDKCLLYQRPASGNWDAAGVHSNVTEAAPRSRDTVRDRKMTHATQHVPDRGRKEPRRVVMLPVLLLTCLLLLLLQGALNIACHIRQEVLPGRPAYEVEDVCGVRGCRSHAKAIMLPASRP
jgi:hypothetical protein